MGCASSGPSSADTPSSAVRPPDPAPAQAIDVKLAPPSEPPSVLAPVSPPPAQAQAQTQPEAAQVPALAVAQTQALVPSRPPPLPSVEQSGARVRSLIPRLPHSNLAERFAAATPASAPRAATPSRIPRSGIALEMSRRGEYRESMSAVLIADADESILAAAEGRRPGAIDVDAVVNGVRAARLAPPPSAVSPPPQARAPPLRRSEAALPVLTLRVGRGRSGTVSTASSSRPSPEASASRFLPNETST